MKRPGRHFCVGEADRKTPEEVAASVTRAKKIVSAPEEFQRKYYAKYLPDSLLRDLGAVGVRREDLRAPSTDRRVA